MDGVADVAIEPELVQALLAEQHPDLAELPVSILAEGWDNTIFRLGGDLTVRLPRRHQGAPLIEHEQRWVPSLVAGLPSPADGGLHTSAALRTGRPGCGYPWPWSVAAWLPGDIVARSSLTDPAADGQRLGSFLAAFHRPAPADAPENPYRGVPLIDRVPALALGLDRITTEGRSLGPTVTRSSVEARAAELVAVPAWDGPPMWLHGDLHAGNVLAHHGRLSAVIDFGDLTGGDPATDLSAAWAVLPARARPAFRAAAGRHRPVDDATWSRAEGWALLLAVAYLAGSVTTSPLIAVARRVLAELAPA